MICRFLSSSPTLRIPYYLLWLCRSTLKITRKDKFILEHIISGNSQISNILSFGNDACRNILEIRLRLLQILNVGSVSEKHKTRNGNLVFAILLKELKQLKESVSPRGGLMQGWESAWGGRVSFN